MTFLELDVSSRGQVPFSVTELVQDELQSEWLSPPQLLLLQHLNTITVSHSKFNKYSLMSLEYLQISKKRMVRTVNE